MYTQEMVVFDRKAYIFGGGGKKGRGIRYHVLIRVVWSSWLQTEIIHLSDSACNILSLHTLHDALS